jgi:hypothetical protein
MPKDPTKNVDRYKIRGGTLNEFELDENQEAYEKQKSKKGGANLIPGTPPEKAKKASTSKKTTKKATKKAAKKVTKTVATRGASAKKLAAQKAAKKK